MGVSLQAVFPESDWCAVAPLSRIDWLPLDPAVVPQAVLGWLAEQFPGLDESALQERLTRLMFAAAVWGRLHGDD